MPDIPWVEKYRPRRLEEFVGNSKAVNQVVSWLKSWSPSSGEKAILLYGPPGVGKTTLALILVRMFNYDLVEMNASDWRTANAVDRVVGRAAEQGTLYGQGRRIILIDEVDGISGSDTGGLASLLNALRRTRNPVILIANDVWQPRFRVLRGVCRLVEFKRLRVREVVKHLKRICLMEGLKADEEALKMIASKSEGDMRSAVNDLQTISYGRKVITVEDVAWIAGRNRLFSIFDALRLVFYAKTANGAKSAISMVDMNPETFFEWIYENTPTQLNDPEDIAEALENLALADLFLSRVKAKQDWKLLSYAVELMTAGVAASRKRSKPRWTPFRFPSRMKFLSLAKTRRALLNQLASKIGSKTHTSKAKAMREHLPYLKAITTLNPDMGKRIAEDFDLTEDELNTLKGEKAEAGTRVSRKGRRLKYRRKR